MPLVAAGRLAAAFPRPRPSGRLAPATAAAQSLDTLVSETKVSRLWAAASLSQQVRDLCTYYASLSQQVRDLLDRNIELCRQNSYFFQQAARIVVDLSDL